ncbi:hypothetical protein B0H14DRAFT_2584670 [Mycena olivaceomarginata]|nr:hypothetical protein B0H14DRAFT_2584670 [Mycena olivaceomarginata]
MELDCTLLRPRQIARPLHPGIFVVEVLARLLKTASSTRGQNTVPGEIHREPSESGPKRKTRRKIRTPEAEKERQLRRTFQCGDAVVSSSFSLLEGASVSQTGWHGALPPALAREQILELYCQTPDARGLYPYIREFYPVRYNKKQSITEEQSVFLVDKNQQIFMFRSFRAGWMVKCINEFKAAHDILVGYDLDSEAVYGGMPGWAPWAPYANYYWPPSSIGSGALGGKVASKFVSKQVELVFPGVAEEFRNDAAAHYQRHGIRPMFGLFWNFCLNTYFPGQERVHCLPDSDKKNQIGVYVVLTYALPCGINFNDTVWTWLVIWEAGVAVQMPPWTMAIYPSSLFYHSTLMWRTFNLSPPILTHSPQRRIPDPSCQAISRVVGSMVFFQPGYHVNPAGDRT